MNTRPEALTVDIEERGGVQVVRPVGALDYGSIGPLREALNRYLDADRPRIVLDLYGVPYCDSSGLGLLLSGQRRAQAVGGWLRVARPHLQMRRMLAVTLLDRHIDTYPNIRDAIDDQHLS